MQGITSIGHVAIKVSDLDRTLDFYVNKLEMPEMFRLTRDDGTPWLLYLRLTDDQYIEVFPGAETDRAPDTGANGLNHMCWTVDDINATVARIRAKGIPLTSEIKRVGDNNRQAWFEDPDGNRIELMEMSPDSLQAKAIAALKSASGA